MNLPGSITGVLLITLTLVFLTSGNPANHGGVPMGESSPDCDDAKVNITIDWDDSTDKDYTCRVGEQEMYEGFFDPLESCITEEKLLDPIHTCMNQKITYEEEIPTNGPHRPLWPVYGEYVYLPPQRWIHSLEHGGVVFLYHPCADEMAVAKFKNIADICLKRHVITPYRNLKSDRPFAILTYGCKLLLGNINIDSIKRAVSFIKTHALTSPERLTYWDGQYDHGLIKNSPMVTDKHDSILCPGW